jgi:hypothetical protein
MLFGCPMKNMWGTFPTCPMPEDNRHVGNVPHVFQLIAVTCKRGLRVAVVTAVFFTTVDGGQARSADVPPYFKRLIETGNVEFEFYDPAKNPHKHLGHTEFRLQVSHRSSFQFGWTPGRGVRYLTIRATIRDVSPRLTHTITVPDWLDSDQRWNDRLMKHEFDHVAISCDPRVIMLVEHLYDGVDKIDQTVKFGTQIDKQFVETLVNERTDSRLKAVITAVMTNQKLLDDVTRHGMRRIADRKKYFDSLYTEPKLKEIGFPYSSEVRKLLKSRAYREAKLPYQVD